MRVLVTGAAGLYGLHTVRELVLRPGVTKVYGIDDFSRGFTGEEEVKRKFLPDTVQLMKQRYQDLTVKELNSLNLDAVIHFAGYASGRESMNTPEEYFLNNESGTFGLMQTLLRTRNKPFLVYASSTEVYGQPKYCPIDENHPAMPNSIYAVTKLAAEKHVLAVAIRCKYPAAALRFSYTYGENQNVFGYTSVVAAFIDRALRNEPLIIYGSGEQSRDFLYVGDAALAVCKALDRQRQIQGTAINIGSGQHLTINGLAEKVIRLAGAGSEIIKLPCRNGLHDGAPLDTSLAAGVLAWKPETGLEEGLKRTINWHKTLQSI